jgi:SAM-dependent methyltransferase
VTTPLPQVLAHSEKNGLAWDPSVAFWRSYYAGRADGSEPGGSERLSVFREALGSVRASGLWLDAGCGIGVMARQFRDSGLKVCAIDMSVELLKEAKGVTGLPLVAAGETPPGEEYLTRSSVERTPYPDEQFDGAYASSVLEYCADLGVALTELHRVVPRHRTSTPQASRTKLVLPPRAPLGLLEVGSHQAARSLGLGAAEVHVLRVREDGRQCPRMGTRPTSYGGETMGRLICSRRCAKTEPLEPT